MGCYQSVPDDKVYITEGKGKNFRYATASCQGWRREQEDAEVCLPYFDTDASLYVLCDGHGGPEVALYTVKYFPDFLKNHIDYKKGDYEKALENSFIEFDQKLRTPEALEKLRVFERGDQDLDMESKESDHTANNAPQSSSAGAGSSIAEPSAGPSTSSGNGSSTVADDVDTETLRKEADIPIEELINKYSSPSHPKTRVQSMRHGSIKIGASPVIRSSRSGCDGSGEDSEDECEASIVTGSSTSSMRREEIFGTPDLNAPRASSPASGIIRNALVRYFEVDDEEDDENDSEYDSKMDDDDDDDEDDDDDDEDEEGDVGNNGEEDEEPSEDSDDEDGDDEREDESATSNKGKSRRFHKRHNRRSSDTTSSSASEGDDDNEVAVEDEDEEDEDDDDEEVDGDYSDNVFPRQFATFLKPGSKLHTPGVDSGCTVVVALVKNGTLYVASAGDSRCIVIMRNGRCEAMSFDHKPEDEIERKRIEAANGSVYEGRVNGGLNLSRAFGDFNYKDINLDPRKQMITPLPHVMKLELDFNEVEFLFLACDGIWNSMSNQKVSKFIHFCYNQNKDLIETCMALFKDCLAPTTDGDGTGCDNMTCILVKYYKDGEKMEDSQITEQSDLNSNIKTIDQKKEALPENSKPIQVTNDEMADSCSAKRSAESDDEIRSDRSSKRKCLRLFEE